MTRPLTVADRSPQVGDVLYLHKMNPKYRLLHTVCRVMEGGRKIHLRDDSPMRSEGVYPMWGAVLEHWAFHSRADGGPVTMEECKR